LPADASLRPDEARHRRRQCLAVGGGVEIVTACDLAIAADHAEFALPSARRARRARRGGLQRWRASALKQAMDLALTGRRIGAEEAKRIGLVNDVVPRAELKARASDVAEMIIAGAPLAIEASSRSCCRGLSLPDLESALRARYPAAERMLESEDAKEGQRAFRRKNASRVWQGR